MKWLKARLQERSTYTGIALLLGLAGVTVPVEAVQLVGSALLAILGAVEMLRTERASDK
jgi:hypothetical protein